MECGEIVGFGMYFEDRAAGIHDILDMGCEKMRELEESSQFVLC